MHGIAAISVRSCIFRSPTIVLGIGRQSHFLRLFAWSWMDGRMEISSGRRYLCTTHVGRCRILVQTPSAMHRFNFSRFPRHVRRGAVGVVPVASVSVGARLPATLFHFPTIVQCSKCPNLDKLWHATSRRMQCGCAKKKWLTLHPLVTTIQTRGKYGHTFVCRTYLTRNIFHVRGLTLSATA